MQSFRARQRWKILASVVKRQAQGVNVIEISVRRFSSYNLFTRKTVGRDNSDREFEWLTFTTARHQQPVFIRQRMRQVVLQDLTGFDNTGNVCLWPSEEVLAYYVLKNADDFKSKAVCEVGAGMTGLAGVLLAVNAGPSEVLLTDGNKDSVLNLQSIINQNNTSFGATSISSRILIWDVKTKLSDLESKFDFVICADCLFVSESHFGLLHVINVLLKEEGCAIVMAPCRKDSLMLFCSKAELYFAVAKSDNYDPVIWERHQSAKVEDPHYNEDIHYPLLLSLSKKKR